jgi:putative spermidine/putrescine transport system permease protein
LRLPRSLLITLNIYALLLAAIMLWPVVQLILSSFTPDVVFPPRYFTTDTVSRVFWPAYFQAMGVSLRMGFWATLLLLIIGLPTAYLLERRRFPGRSLLSALIFVPAIFPTITYAIAIGVYIALYITQWTGSFPIIVIATATGAIPLVVRTIQGSLATTDPVYEEAALVMGASPMRTFFKVTLPLIAPGVITAGAIAFTFTATTFTIPWLMGAREQPVAVYIYRDVERLGYTPEVAVKVLVMQFVTIGIAQILFRVFRKQFRGAFA